jgi:hypothetical protein
MYKKMVGNDEYFRSENVKGRGDSENLDINRKYIKIGYKETVYAEVG